ncbi:MAG: DUF1572 family protein [Parafilimonas sp.]
MQSEETFLKDSIKRFRADKALADKTFAQLEEKDFFYQPSSESNSIAIIIQHLHGNMMSRWTNFLTEDGEKSWRQRDAEFEPSAPNKSKLLSLWEAGWHCVFTALEQLEPADLMKTIYIRNEPLTVCDAIIRQIAHYAYHVGQIIFVGKIIKDANWQTLSIAKRKAMNSISK